MSHMTRPSTLDISEEEILICDASDAALEAAGAVSAANAMSFSFCTSVYVCPCWPPPAAGRSPER
jgi:hypothetical protein